MKTAMILEYLTGGLYATAGITGYSIGRHEFIEAGCSTLLCCIIWLIGKIIVTVHNNKIQ